MTQHSAITTAGLTKHYPGVAALTDLTLDVPAGSVYGFLGPNGAGKSTTIKLLAGLAAPTRGTASVAGIPVSAGAAYRREVGYLAQDPRFYDWMTGRETVRFVASLFADGRSGRRHPASRRAGRRGRPPDRHLLGRHAPAPWHRPGPRRRAQRPAP
jgi:ABC-2 type transport system ATP-binding protein